MFLEMEENVLYRSLQVNKEGQNLEDFSSLVMFLIDLAAWFQGTMASLVGRVWAMEAAPLSIIHGSGIHL